MGTKADVQVGKKFGKWTVLEIEVKNPESQAKRVRKGALCQCECGTKRYIEYRSLYDGRTHSCGCNGWQTARDIHYQSGIIPVGTKFGSLTVLEDAGMINKKHCSKCICECGTIKTYPNTHLKLGHTTSCGCIKSHGEKKIRETLSKNNVNFTTEYVIPELLSEKGGYLRFDFAIFQDNRLYKLIEFNGPQHYGPQSGYYEGKFDEIQKRDKLKIEYCKKHNIPLQIIKYDEIENINIKMLLQK